MRPRFVVPTRLKRALALTSLVTLTGAAIGLVYGAFTLKAIAEKLPAVGNITDLKIPPYTTIVSSDGVLLATLQTNYRRPVSLTEMSPSLVDATVAIEDNRFFEHGGVDPRGIARAIFANLRRSNAYSQGASTITQQLARNLYLTQEKSFRRKIEEILLARRIEAQFSKREILEAYLNTAYYGNGNYGVEAAARSYFGKPASKLSLAQAALLAGLPQRPIAYSPVLHLKDALKREATVLSRMAATGKITLTQEDGARAEKIHILPPHSENSMRDWKAPYYVRHVIADLKAKYGPEFLYSGAQITTTLNWAEQVAAEKSLRKALGRGAGPNTGAVVALDPHNGYVRALVGGADFKRDQYDAATQGLRQPGSAFKPIVYATAFDTGICNLMTLVTDQKMTYTAQPKDWTVHNYENGYRGPISVLDAIRNSVNTVAVQVADAAGPGMIADYGRRLGISSRLDPVLPIALGASAVRPIDLCSAYTAFAAGGDRYDPTFIQEIKDRYGRSIYRDDPGVRFHKGFMSADALDQINVALRDVVLQGTGMPASSVPDAHGKTGTTSSHRDAWFVGYNSELATAVWVAHVDRTSTQTKGHARLITTKYLPMPGETGGRLCAPIWRDFMAAAAPVQHRVNAAHGIQFGPVEAPTKDSLVARLSSAADTTVLGQQHTDALAALAAKSQEQQDGFTGDPANRNGSGVSTSFVQQDDSVEHTTQPDEAADVPADEPTQWRVLPGDGAGTASRDENSDPQASRGSYENLIR